MDVEVSSAAVLPELLLAAVNDPLVDLGQAKIKGNTLLRQIVPYSTPVAGEGRAGPEVAGICTGWRCFRCPSIYTE